MKIGDGNIPHDPAQNAEVANFVTIIGLRDGAEIFSKDLTPLSDGQHEEVNLNFIDIDSVQIVVTGG